MKLRVIIILSFVLISACARNGADKEKDEPQPISVSTDFDNKSNKKNIRDAEPFYPMDETIEDIQDQVSELKSRVIEYESRINRIALDPTLLKMVKTPSIQHEIELTNGTVVQGSILQEDIERIILKTQIGQIRIEKADIIAIKETAPNSPDLKFNSEPSEKQFEDKRNFSGSIPAFFMSMIPSDNDNANNEICIFIASFMVCALPDSPRKNILLAIVLKIF